jgi:hypothetical protein
MPKKVPSDCIQKMGDEWFRFLKQIEPSKQQPKAIALTGSPMVLTAQEIGDYVVSGGTVSAIELSRNGAAYINLGVTAGMFRVTFNDLLKVTYTVAPTVNYLQS